MNKNKLRSLLKIIFIRFIIPFFIGFVLIQIGRKIYNTGYKKGFDNAIDNIHSIIKKRLEEENPDKIPKNSIKEII